MGVDVHCGPVRDKDGGFDGYSSSDTGILCSATDDSFVFYWVSSDPPRVSLPLHR